MFESILAGIPVSTVNERLATFTAVDVTAAMERPRKTAWDFLAMVSPAARPFIDQMAEKSYQLTRQRFGKTIQMYAPLYLSNECQNICTYCGYSFDHKLRRKTLTDAEILTEAEAIRNMGFRHVLLVTGEANATVNLPYFPPCDRTAQASVREHFAGSAATRDGGVRRAS
jgi:2-iminoacetate synthase